MARFTDGFDSNGIIELRKQLDGLLEMDRFSADLKESFVFYKQGLDLLHDTADENRDAAWHKILVSTKKGIEERLYDFVTRGCNADHVVNNAFPELQFYYNEDSYELLDQKIKVLTEIAKRGIDCDCGTVEGFDEILENKEEGVLITGHID